ncbi:hypothetical protein DES40_1713 [Litorimonas taeanensis]|uniref:Fibronectin type-III domain-containing protein n=1 Tax=Litorimonas taeanensis TaxID=568099 RepID=A0A420WD46_9PROT|nr:hypothetical protein [Litorimonas taeanensis]RKQ68937.1 hypothetical protein DES40_1713 [Litorimonas taeanensis]
MSHSISAEKLDRFCQPRLVNFVAGKSLLEVMNAALPDPILRAHAVILMAGEIIPRKNWSHIRPKAQTRVQIGLKPAGQTGKKILKTVLIIAVAVVAAWIAGPTAAGAFLFGSKTAAAVAAAAFTLTANLAINALLPVPTTSGNARAETDPTYSLQGTQNRLRPREVVEVILGEHRYTPSLITEQYQEPVGDDIWISFGVCVGVGDYVFSDWRLGDTPLSNYSGVEIQEQATQDAPRQTLIPGDFTQTDLGVDLDTTWHIERTADDVADIDVMLSFARGLGTSDDSGNPQSVSVTVDVQYRVVYPDEGAGETYGDWENAGPNNGAVADSYWDPEMRGGRYDYWSNFSTFSEYHQAVISQSNGLSKTYRRSDIKPFADRIRFSVPPGRQYDVRVRRTTAKNTDSLVANDVSWFKLNSWSKKDLTPEPKLATAFFRMKASGELSGLVSNLNVRAQKIIPTFNADPETFDPALASAAHWDNNPTPSRNCADVLLDAVRGAHTKRPTPDTEIYWPDYAAFWLWCDENNYNFDLPIAQDLARREVEEMIAAAGRGRVFRGSDGKKHIAIDRPRLEGPSQIITPKNARGFVFTRTFSQAIHALRIPFTNRDNNFQDDEVTVYAPGFDALSATEFQEISTPGQTQYDRVYESGDYYLSSARLLSTVANFEMDIEGTTLQLGDFVRLQHPILNSVADSARILSVAGNSLRLDKPIEFGLGEDYILRYRKIFDHEDGTASIEAQGWVSILNPELTTDIITLGEALPEGVALDPDDLVIIGIAGEDSFEGLVKHLEPSGPRQFDVELVAYLPERLTKPALPEHVPSGPTNWTAPPLPLLIGVTSSRDSITVTFDLPDGYKSGLAGFETRYWRTGGAGEDVSPITGPTLSPDARKFSFEAGLPDRQYNAEIRSVDFDGQRSSPLLVENITSASFVPAPLGASAIGRVQTNSDGVKFPVVDIQVNPVDPAIFETLLIERRVSGSTDWGAPTTAPAENPTKTLTGLTPGVPIDIRLSWRDVRGSVTALSDKVVLTDIAVPSEFTAGNSVAIGGQPADEVLAHIQTALSGVDDLVETYGDTVSAAQSASEALGFKDAAEAHAQTSAAAQNLAEIAQGAAETALTAVQGLETSAQSAKTAAETAKLAAETAQSSAVTHSEMSVLAASKEGLTVNPYFELGDKGWDTQYNTHSVLETYAGRQHVLRLPQTRFNVYSAERIPVAQGRTYKLSGAYRTDSTVTAQYYIGVQTFDASGNVTGSDAGYLYIGVPGHFTKDTDGWIDFESDPVSHTGIDPSAPFKFPADCTQVRLVIFSDYNSEANDDSYFDTLLFCDITESDAALKSALASASSQTAAGASATAAEQNAIIASSERVLAETARSGAETAETNSAQSASDAQSSSAQASTFKDQAATAATNAGDFATAANSSASLAEGYADDSEQSASAANQAKLAAETAESNAAISETNAATSETNAGNSETAASSHAAAANQHRLEAVAAKDDSENAATAAAQSAASAAASDTSAGQSASAADTSRVSAETAESNAAISETNAASSETNAGNSETAASSHAAAANQHRLEAVAAKDDSENAATAAAQSAASAAASDTSAGQSASAADTSRVSAETAESNAAISETNAATSETNAEGSAVAALAAQTLVATTQADIEFSQSKQYDQDFSKGDYWVGGYTLSQAQLDAAPPAQESYSNITIEDVSGEGKVLEHAGSTLRIISERSSRPFIENQIVKLTIRRRLTTGTETLSYISIVGLTETGAYSVFTSKSMSAQTVADGWLNRDIEFNPFALRAAATNGFENASTWRFAFDTARGGSSDCIAQISFVAVEDITQTKLAQSEAQAAATSAAEALASEGAAGAFAFASDGSATEAQGYAANAATSVTQASAFADDAEDAKDAVVAAELRINTAVETAESHADTAIEQSTNAAAAAASAQNLYVASAAIRSGAINPNSTFETYDSGVLPDSWTSLGGAGVSVAGGVSPYAFQQISDGASGAGIRYLSADDSRFSTGYWLISADITLETGTLNGSGLQIITRNAASTSLASYTLNFSSEPDSSGNIIGAGVPGKRYRFSKLIHCQDGAEAILDLRAYTTGALFGLNQGSRTITWHKAAIAPSTQSDIEASRVPNIIAESALTQAAVVGLENYAAAGATLSVRANNEISGLYLRASDTGTVTESDFIMSADKLRHEADGEVIWYSDANGMTLNKALRWVGGGTPTNPTTMYVLGLGFGANSDLMEWFGPYSATVDGCTKTNGKRAKTIDGESYLEGGKEGGTPISASNSSTGTTAEITSIGSNGNTTEATMAFLRTGNRTYWSSTDAGNTSYTKGAATLKLYREEGSSGYVLAHTLSVTGIVTRTTSPYDPEFGQYHVSETFHMSGTYVHEQVSSSAETYNWKTVIDSESDLPTPTTGALAWTFSRSVSISIFEPSN